MIDELPLRARELKIPDPAVELTSSKPANVIQDEAEAAVEAWQDCAHKSGFVS
jgi:hypothetical protein